MSRLAKRPIELPPSVQASLASGAVVLKKDGVEKTIDISPLVKVSIDGSKISLSGEGDDAKKFLGLARARIVGVSSDLVTPYSKTVNLVGVGFKTNLKGSILSVSLGYSHDIKMVMPKELKVEVKDTSIKISGSDRVLVGQVVGKLLKLKRYDPYKGKGVIQEGVKMRRKENKKK